VFTKSDIQEAVVKTHDNKQKHMMVTFAKDESANSLSEVSGLPQLYFE